jgi:hypothetical protein
MALCDAAPVGSVGQHIDLLQREPMKEMLHHIVTIYNNIVAAGSGGVAL